MENKIKFSCVGVGVLRGTILTLILLVIYSGVTTLVPDNLKVKSILFMVFTCVSVLYGAAYAAKKAQQKGWIIGILVAIVYCVLLYIVSIIAGRDAAITIKDVVRLVLAMAVGTLSGMLGINL